jgi:tetratricopeptide (TPR) repeat protein
MAAGRYSDAVPLYAQLVKEVPGNPGLMLNLGMALHMSGRDREAVVEFDKILALQPSAYPALMMKAVSHMRLGEPARAVPAFESAIKTDPKDIEARRMLADALLMLGRLESASTQLRALASAVPQDPKAWFGLGRTYEQLAQNTYESLLKTAPNSPFTIAVTAEARLKQGKFESAETLFRKAGETPGAHAGLAELFEKTGRSDQAAAERAKEPTPGCTTPSLACTYRGRKYTALLQSTRLQKTPESLFWRIRAYNQLALDAFRKLTDLPPSAELYEVLAELNRNQGRYKESVDAWNQALQLTPGDARLRRELAATVYLSRDYAEAERLLRSELAQDATSAELQFMLGDSLLNQQKAADAIPFLNKSVELDPKYMAAHASLARAYTRLGQTEKAVPHLERALPVDTDGALHYQLARAYQASGRTAEAKALLVRYQELQKAQ